MYILASASPRRKELLSKITNDFKIVSSSIDEEEILSKNVRPALEIPEFLATQKALDVAKKHPNCTIIAADTAIVLEDTIYGKPKDKNDAKKMLTKFSGNTHFVVTGVCIVYTNKTISFSSINEVTFYKLSKEEIDNYLSIDEYVDKAGSYAIQGEGFKFIKSIKGDYYSIIGLPIAEIKRVLKNYF